MQGPWAYDDSMGGHSILAADTQGTACGACGGAPHEGACASPEGDRRA